LRNYNRIVSLSIILLLLFSSITFITAPEEDPFVVSVHVTNTKNGAPVVGASVTINNLNTGDSISGTTDSDGDCYNKNINISGTTEVGHTINVVATHNGGSGEINHSVTSGDVDNRFVILSMNLTYPKLEVTLNKNEDQCNHTATFTANATGGDGNYTYDWTKNGGGTYDTNLNVLTVTGEGISGTVTVDVSDTAGQDDSASLGYDLDASLSITCSTGNEDHCNGRVTASVYVTGGSGPITIDWDKDDNGTYDILNGSATETFDVGYGVNDNFRVRVSDDCSTLYCTDSYSIYPKLDVAIDEQLEINCEHTQITFVASASGGSGNYSYAWCADEDGQYNDGDGTTFKLDCDINELGTVSVKVNDISTGCTDTDSANWNSSYAEFNASGSWDVNCDGELILKIDAEGGTPPYKYEIKINGDVVSSSSTYIHNAGWGSSGTWSWKVTDYCVDFKESASPINWQLPDELTVDIINVNINHCSGSATFTADATGGSNNYSYDWDLDNDGSYEVTNGGTSKTIIGYGKSGTVKVRVTDTEHGCTATNSTTYGINPELTVELQVIIDHCSSTATFTALPEGGGGAGYSFDWDMDNDGTYEIIDGGNQQIINDGPDQNGKVKVRVSDGICQNLDTVSYTINPLLSLNLDVDYGDGVAIFTTEANGGGENYKYDWDMDNDGTYEIIDGGQEQRLYGYDKQGTVNARVTDICSDQVEESANFDIPEELIVNPPTEVIVKGIFELDGTPHTGSPTYYVMWYPDTDANSYIVQESVTSNFSVISNEFITNSTRKKISNMPDGEYYYRVQSCNDAGCTDWSNTMKAVVGEALMAPNPPTTLVAEGTSETSILLIWNDNADDEDGFRIYRNGTLIHTVDANVESYTDNGLDCGTSYTYYIMAYNEFGISPTSNIANGLTEGCVQVPSIPGPPTDVEADAISQNDVDVSWTDASMDETGFKLYRDGTLIADLLSDTTEYRDTGLECGISHSYYLVAYNANGESAASESALATTDECAQPPTTKPVASDNYIKATLMSPAYLHALDAEGRHIGRISIDQAEIEIPGGTYSGLDSHPQVITVYNPQSEIQFYFEAYDEGTVTLNVEASENGTTETYKFENLSVKNGTVFLVNSGAATGQLDLDGDGVYEEEISGVMIQDDDDGGSNTMMYVALVIVVILIAAAVLYLQGSKKE